MARPRTPTNILDARGAFKKNPQRARVDEPEAAGDIGEAPGHFNQLQAECWSEIVDTAHAGVLCKADRLAVETAAQLLAQSRENWLDMKSADKNLLVALLARFGMTPSDRSKVVAPKAPAVNPFAELLAKG